MRNFWYIAADARDLRARPLARRILGEPIVLFRDAEGRPQALLDRCPHRNVKLSGGTVADGRVRCPYHGWEFEGSGRCAYVPSLCAGEAIPSTARVAAYEAREQDGYVWVWVGDAPPPEGSRPFAFPHRGEAGWANARMKVVRIPNAVENVVENFIDTSHTGYVHGGLFRSPANHSARTRVQMVEDGVVIDIDEENQADSLLARLLVPKGAQVLHQDRFYLPSIVRVHYGFGPEKHIIGFQVCTPVDDFETDVYVYLTWKFGVLTPLMGPFMPHVGKVVLDQDMGVLVSQAEVIKEHGEKFVSCPADTANLWIRAVRERAKKGEPPMVREKQVEYRL
jgi:phenylpropionate dioxygenase-like ring-hydroxylating dioxygenase large terminal subunit